MIRVLDAKGWDAKYGVKAAVMDAQDLKYPDEKFTHVFMNLGIFALPDPLKGTKEIFRTLTSPGIALVTTIRGTGWLAPFQKAIKAIKPDGPEFHGILPPDWVKSEKITGLLEEGGFTNVEVREAGASMDMKGFAVNQKHLIKMSRDMIVKGWTDQEAIAFDETLAKELELEENSGVPRAMEVWVGIATK
jgi:SAM-dependent methyltransferase